MKKIINYIAFSLLFVPNMAQSQIDGILQSIANNNMELKADKATFRADSLDISTSNNLQDPNVDFEYLFGNHTGGDKWGVGISQSFDWPTVYSKKSQLNRHKTNALFQAQMQSRLELLLRAKLLCIDLINQNKLLDYRTTIFQNIDSLLAQYQKGFNHGEISILDINKLKIERLDAKQALDNTVAQRISIIKELTGLNANINIPRLEMLNEYPVAVLASLDIYLEQQKRFDPQYNYYAAIDDILSREFDVAKAQALPKFALGYKYSNEIGENFNGVTAGVSLPIFSNRGKKKALKAQELANSYNQNSHAIEKEANINSDYNKAIAIEHQINSYKEAIGNDSNLALLEKALAGGHITLLEYLLEVRYFTEINQKLINLEYEYNLLCSSLNKYELLKY